MRVQDVMTKTVHTVTPETPLKRVAAVLAALGISGLPVLDADGAVVGIVSEADILYKERLEPPARGRLRTLLGPAQADAEKAKLEARTAGEAMTSPALTIGPRRPVAEAAGRMLDEHVNRLPVVDDAGRLLGIVTRADLVRAFVRTDDEIADRGRAPRGARPPRCWRRLRRVGRDLDRERAAYLGARPRPRPRPA